MADNSAWAEAIGISNMKNTKPKIEDGMRQGNFIGGIGMVSEWGIGDYIIITGEKGQYEIKTRRNGYKYRRFILEDAYVT